MRLAWTALQMLGKCLFAIGIALVLFLVVLSDGKILNPIAVADRGTVPVAIALICWVILLGFGWLLTVGEWKRHRKLKRAVLTGLLMLPPLLAIFSLLPETAPSWAGAALSGLIALVAIIVSDRLVPEERR